MKKMIAISVMCVLVIGAAFAETTVGGAIFVGGKLMTGTNEEGSHPQSGAIGTDSYNTLVKLTFGDSKAGGWLSMHNNNGNFYHWFAWWRPIPQLRVQIGRNADGDFGNQQISGWGYTGESKNTLGAMGEYSGEIFGLAHSRVTGWYAGNSAPNLNFSVFPIEGLTINLMIPFNSSQAAAATFLKSELSAVYQIPDIGRVSFAFQGNTGYLEADPVKDGPRVKDADYDENQKPTWWETEQTGTPKFFVSFYLTAIENMAIDLGLAYQLPLNYSYQIAETKYVDEYTYNYNQNFPFEIGLGYRITMGDLAIKARAGISLGGSVEETNAKTFVDEESKEATKISFNILPSYKIAGMTVYLYAGLGIQIVDDWETTKRTPDMAFGGYSYKVGGFKANESNAAVSWFVNPYVHIPAGDSLRFQVGFQLYSDGVKYPNGDPALIKWSIPFGFYTYF